MAFDQKAEVAEFFNFFGRHGARWWFIEAQPRKLDGERGAPIGSKFGFKFAVHFDKCGAAFCRLSSKLASTGKNMVDLQTRESPYFDFGRVMLIDDLPSDSVDDLLDWWTGPILTLETSPMNFQSLLVSPVGLNSSQLLRCQRALAHRFGGDSGATSSGQLHRLPFSPNYKAAALVDGQPFLTRLVQIEDGANDGSIQMKELLSNSAIYSRPKAKPERSKNRKPGPTNSDAAFAYVFSQIKNATSDQLILACLRDKFISDHAADWPERTLWNAYFKLGLRSEKYSSEKLRDENGDVYFVQQFGKTAR